MDLRQTDLGQYARELLARRGLDIEQMPEPAPYGLADHLADASSVMLDAVLSPRFRNAECSHPDVIEWSDRYLADPTGAPNLYLSGAVGTGKTHQAIGALRRIVAANAQRCTRMTFAVTNQGDFDAAMRPHTDGKHIEELADLQGADLLVFDDLGAGKATDWSDTTLFRLVDARWTRRLPMIVTTNLLGSGLEARLDERSFSRITAGAVEIELKGDDRRWGES